MSSFVIEKRAFVRVAGMVSGIRDYTNRVYRFNRLHIWDSENHREMDDDGIRARFIRCWEMNVDSVAKQYNDDPGMYDDSDDYMIDWIMYHDYARKAASDPVKLMDMVYEFVYFGRSVNYQIEDEADCEETVGWFNFIIAQLITLTDCSRDDRNSWGSFELDGVA